MTAPAGPTALCVAQMHVLQRDTNVGTGLLGGHSLTVERPHRTFLAIVLAAGEGTRMRSDRPKVLHAIAGRSLLAHVLAAVREAGGTTTAVVVGPNAEPVAAEARRILPDAEI